MIAFSFLNELLMSRYHKYFERLICVNLFAILFMYHHLVSLGQLRAELKMKGELYYFFWFLFSKAILIGVLKETIRMRKKVPCRRKPSGLQVEA